MKQLRILTGIHAGATVPLCPGRHRIDAEDDADIRITDWTGPSVIVEVNDARLVVVRRLPQNGASDSVSDDLVAANAIQPNEVVAHDTFAQDSADTTPVLMLDFLPMQFDQSVICVGPDDVEWPSDLALLSTLLKAGVSAEAPDGEVRPQRKTFYAIGAACIAIVAVICVTTLSITTPRAKASLLPPDVASMETINSRLAAAHLNELKANLDGHGGVIVRGMVTNEAESLAALRLLGSLKSMRVQSQYGIAERIRRGISESLSIDGITVRYDGGGIFSVVGKNIDLDGLQQGLKRIRPDLPSYVRDIRVEATGNAQPAAPSGASYIAIVSSNTVRYAQTPDGVKHIFILDDDTADSSMASGASATGSTAMPASATNPLAIDEATLHRWSELNEDGRGRLGMSPSPLAKTSAELGATAHTEIGPPRSAVPRTATISRR
ncbi:FHA domain-containing protein [Burkholderia metallica]|uniref:FHA domain-containing protein n=1 Tax=Burkholderia metallica TaxID=488729 RepID=UPI001CF21BAD|nr:FHA domain-containing protein [Burkholderia metallica]MCA8002733.1 FHA domain-containing protein [Burkholderia metallica]